MANTNTAEDDMTKKIEQWLMTDWGYTCDRASELVRANMGFIGRLTHGGWNNREIAEKLVSLGRTPEPYRF